jgi:LCP family protein required for cell wall assembly
VNGVNSDVVMVLHLDSANRSASILSIPRDLFVPNARTSGANKIDAALAQGPSQLADAIEEDFGIPIEHFAVLNFDSFQGVVDALGGIDMYFPMPLYDSYSSLNIPTPGCHHLNGFEALAVVRARHLQYKPPNVTTSDRAYWPQDPESDLSRIRRDHEFLRVLASQVAKRGLGNPFTDQSLVSAVAPDLEVDSGLSLRQMVSLVLTFRAVDPVNAPQWTLPVLVSSSYHYSYQGYDYGNIEMPSEPEDSQVIHEFLGIGAGRDTLTGKTLPVAGSVRVSVLNGSGVAGGAGSAATALGALGFQVVGTADTNPVGTSSETVVTYSADDPAGVARAEAVARDISGAVVMATGTPSYGAEVTVVTGSDFSIAVPASIGAARGGTARPSEAPPASNPSSASSSAGPSGASSSTASSTAASRPTSRSDATLSAPTSSSQPLAPFDPRSCTSGGGEGP